MLGQRCYLFCGRLLRSSSDLPEIPAASEQVPPDTVHKTGSQTEHIDGKATSDARTLGVRPIFVECDIDPRPIRSDPKWIHHSRSQDGGLVYSTGHTRDGYLLRFPDVGEFLVDSAMRRVRCRSSPGTDPATLRHVLLDQVLPQVLGHAGEVVFHASTILSPAGVIAFLGDTGAGKSTLAASFSAQYRWPVSDDCVLVEIDGANARATPGYYGVRLLPDSARALSDHIPGQREAQSHGTKRRFVPLANSGMTAPAHAVLTACFILERGDVSARVPVLSRPEPANALMELLRYSFVIDPMTAEGRPLRLARLARIVETVPCFRLSYPRSYNVLPDVQHMILEAALAHQRT